MDTKLNLRNEPKLLGEVIRDLIQQGAILVNSKLNNYGKN